MVNSLKLEYTNSYVHYDDQDPKWENGDLVHYQNDLYHNANGAAIIYAVGDRYWYLHGELHRTDGPAVLLKDGYEEYWIEGEQYSKEEWLKIKDITY